MKPHISPKELGRAVGASESSLKRWTDEGLLRAVRTAGGHRRIAIGEAVRFIRETGMAVIDPNAIGLPDLADSIEPDATSDSPAQSLAAALIHGNAPRVRGLILSAYLASDEAARICDQLIAPALHQIGELWRHDARGIFIEHRATAICIEAVHQLRSLFPAPDHAAPVAVGGALAGDVYAIPSLMAATVLASAGWREMNLGPDTPDDALLIAAQTARARLAWVSISAPGDEAELTRQLELLAGELLLMNTRLIVGGRCVPPRVRHANMQIAGSMSELAAYAAGIRIAN